MANKQNKQILSNAVLQNKVNIQKKDEPKRVFSNVKLALLLGLISFIAYTNTVKNGFVLDDFHVIAENTIVAKGVSAIPEILSTPYRRGFLITSNDLYRPLSLVMFAIEGQFFGKNPAPYHFINILFFAGCVILLFLFLDKLFDHKKTAVAFIASLLFALHPIHTEVVANIKSRDELLCFFFAFLSLNVFFKYVQSGKQAHLLTGICCFFLSLLSKETVITFLALIPFSFFFHKNGNKKRSTYITAGIGLAAIVFLVIRFSVLNSYHANNIATIPFIDNALAKQDLSFQSRIATAILILGYYMKLLFVPYPLICDYSFKSIPFAGFADSGVLITLAIYTMLIILMVKRFLKNRQDPFAFCILFFFITISLFTNIPFLIGTTMGERLMFFPSVGFCLAVAVLIEKWIGETTDVGLSVLKQPKVLGIIIPLSIVYLIIASDRNGDWADNYTLYGTDVKKVTNNCKLNYNMSVELQKMAKDEKDPGKQGKMIAEAIAFLRKAIAVYPEFDDAEANLGYAYFSMAAYDSSELHDRKALRINPKNIIAINDLASAYFFNKKYPEAIGLYKNSIELSPDYVKSYANIGVCYLYLSKPDSAIYYSMKAMSVDPSFNSSYEILASAFMANNKPDSAKKYEAIAQKNNPQFKL